MVMEFIGTKQINKYHYQNKTNHIKQILKLRKNKESKKNLIKRRKRKQNEISKFIIWKKNKVNIFIIIVNLFVNH